MSNQITEQHYKNFVATFYKFLYDINRYVPTLEVDQILAAYKDFDMVKVIFRVHKLLKANENEINQNNMKLFSEEFCILPSIDLSSLWRKMNSNQQKKIWTYLGMLLLQTDIFYGVNDDNHDNHDNTVNEKQIATTEFNPYVGIGNSNQNYSLNEMLSSIPTIEEDQPMDMGIDAITKMMGLDKMININEISDKLKNMTDEDLDKAKVQLKKAFGAENDEATGNFINTMVESLADEVKKDDNKSFQKILETMAPKVQASIAENNLNIPQLMNSAKNFAKQQNPNAAQMFGGIDPFAMIERFAGGTMNEQECKKECDNMMKSMGMNMGDMGNMMNMMNMMQPPQNNSSRAHPNPTNQQNQQNQMSMGRGKKARNNRK